MQEGTSCFRRTSTLVGSGTICGWQLVMEKHLPTCTGRPVLLASTSTDSHLALDTQKLLSAYCRAEQQGRGAAHDEA